MQARSLIQVQLFLVDIPAYTYQNQDFAATKITTRARGDQISAVTYSNYAKALQAPIGKLAIAYLPILAASALFIGCLMQLFGRRLRALPSLRGICKGYADKAYAYEFVVVCFTSLQARQDLIVAR